jgi:septin family protein
MRRLRHRADNFRQHSLRQEGPRAQGVGRPYSGARRGRRQDPAHHRRYVFAVDPEERSRLANIAPELDEEGTRISLTIVDTPGFGDQIDNEAR